MLLICRDALLVLDLGLGIVDCSGGLNFQGDSLASQGLDLDDLQVAGDDCHLQVELILLSNAVSGKQLTIFHLGAIIAQPLQICLDTSQVVDPLFDMCDGIGSGIDAKFKAIPPVGVTVTPDKDLIEAIPRVGGILVLVPKFMRFISEDGHFKGWG